MPLLAHFGIGFGGKGLDPRIPTWALVGSAILLDLLALVTFFFSETWFHHGLVMAGVWSLIAMGITWILVSRSNTLQASQQNGVAPLPPKRTTLIIGLLVMSHWVLDAIGWPMIMYNPDASGVPVFFDDTITVGLGVYRTWAGAIIIELGVLFLGLIIYYRNSPNKNSIR
jgi:hypothetical protein